MVKLFRFVTLPARWLEVSISVFRWIRRKKSKDISINTNVLGINAAIQSAHIGSAGAGFGVISREIRTLVEKAQDSVRQIDKGIKGVLESINQFSLESKELSNISNVQVDFTGKITSNINDLSDMSKNLLKIAENLISN